MSKPGVADCLLYVWTWVEEYRRWGGGKMKLGAPEVVHTSAQVMLDPADGVLRYAEIYDAYGVRVWAHHPHPYPDGVPLCPRPGLSMPTPQPESGRGGQG